MLLSGDLFEAKASLQTVRNVQKALEKAGMPVFICPGNHDFICPDSPYEADGWPENVHIFKIYNLLININGGDAHEYKDSV